MIKLKELIDTQTTLDGDKVKIDEVLNKPIVITGAKITNSKYKKKGVEWCTKIQFHYENDTTPLVFFTGSQVIKDQIESVISTLEEKDLTFEVLTEVKKVGNYYSLI